MKIETVTDTTIRAYVVSVFETPEYQVISIPDFGIFRSDRLPNTQFVEDYFNRGRLMETYKLRNLLKTTT